MNATIKLLVVLTLVFNFTSCKKELGTVNFNTLIDKTISVHVDQTDGSAFTFSTDELMSLDNDDTHDY